MQGKAVEVCAFVAALCPREQTVSKVRDAVEEKHLGSRESR